MQRISPKVKSVKRRGAGRAGENVADGMAFIGTFGAKIVVCALNEEFI